MKLPGKLKICVLGANNIQVANSSSFPQCFVTISFEKQLFQTALTSPSQNPRWGNVYIFDITDASSTIIISLWQRGSIGNVFLGSVERNVSSLERCQNNITLQFQKRNSNLLSGDLSIASSYTSFDHKLCPEDFELIKVLGKGSFGKVLLVKKRDTSSLYAMKVIKKEAIIARQEVDHTRSEQNILKMSQHPFIVGLKYSFQTNEKLYLVLDFINGGELFFHLQNDGRFSEQRAGFYTAELVLALEHLHRNGVIYRDLKTENILLSSSGHICLTDFGLCKEGVSLSVDERTQTFCGTPEYLAPEVLRGEMYGHCVDWWSLGTLLFEMLTGLPPFYNEDVNVMYQRILEEPLVLPDFLSREAKDLLSRLLTRDPTQRLGSGPEDADPIKAHPFFRNIDWNGLMKKEIDAPFFPNVSHELDTSNFDDTFTCEAAVDSVVESTLSATMQAKFEGFTFVDSDLQ
eukprot:GCRY01001094.1.p1 GENE.GCRY01001094.1~~GCRY01001094.1.p1  ORF type:complete len:460 (+),score=71.42 GCRY01001094.1:88-1467(+)